MLTFLYSWASNLDGPEDWNIVSEKGTGINNRQVKLSRGKFLGGSSGLNGTLCIKGSKQDYDDWGLDGWSGEEFFSCMQKVSHPCLPCFADRCIVFYTITDVGAVGGRDVPPKAVVQGSQQVSRVPRAAPHRATRLGTYLKARPRVHDL